MELEVMLKFTWKHKHARMTKKMLRGGGSLPETQGGPRSSTQGPSVWGRRCLSPYSNQDLSSNVVRGQVGNLEKDKGRAILTLSTRVNHRPDV